MTDIDELIEKVVGESGKDMDEIRKRMDQRKEKTHGLLSDYGAIYAVAKELGINLSDETPQFTKISELKVQTSINLFGRVKQILEPKTFKRKDGSEGVFASIVIIDEGGSVRIVLWDQNAKATEQLSIQDVLFIQNGYVKENRGELEIHAGGISKLSINPPGYGEELPKIEEKIQTISTIEAGNPSLSFVARVTNYYPATEFDRKDGSKGSRASFLAEDETGTVRVVLWDDASKTKINEADILKLENAYSKQGLNQDVEVHAGAKTKITKSDKKLDLPPMKKKKDKVKVKEIEADMSGFTLIARVLRVFAPKEYSKGVMISIIVGDETGSIRCVFWNDMHQHAQDLSQDDVVKLTNIYSKTNLNGEPEIHVGKYSTVEKEKTSKIPSTEEINSKLTTEKKIADLDAQDSFVKISGKITQIEDRPLLFMKCSECGGKVQNLGGELMCDGCGIVEGTPNMLCSFVLEDKSGNIRAVAFGEQAQKLLGLSLEDAKALQEDSDDGSSYLAWANENVIGKEVTVLGRVKYNQFRDSLEFNVNEVP